jgi:hypothetical protein
VCFAIHALHAIVAASEIANTGQKAKPARFETGS